MNDPFFLQSMYDVRSIPMIQTDWYKHIAPETWSWVTAESLLRRNIAWFVSKNGGIIEHFEQIQKTEKQS